MHANQWHCVYIVVPNNTGDNFYSYSRLNLIGGVNKIVMPRKYDKVRDCPEDLEVEILLANILPLDIVMPDILGYVRVKNEFIKDRIDKRRKEVKEYFGETMPNLITLTLFYNICIENYQPETLITLRNVLIDCLKRLPSDFFTTLRELTKLQHLNLKNLKKASHTEIDTLVVAYDFIRNTRQSMLEFIFRLESERKGFSRTGGYFPFTIPATIERDKEGNYSVAGLAGLIGSFDPNRLKLCPICQYIYWAKRLDSKTCGDSTCIDGFQNQKKKRSKESGSL